MWAQGLMATATAGLLICGQALAHGDHRHRGGRDIVYARVVDAVPIVRAVTVERPRRECWQDIEYRAGTPARVAGTTLAGGIVGAAIGRQFGDGSGRDAMTVLGGLAGSLAAHNYALRRPGAYDAYPVSVERCAVVNEHVTEDVIDGYHVTYLHRGRLHSMRTVEHPGAYVPLRASFRPVRF